MDEQAASQEPQSSNKVIPAVIIVVILLLAAGGFLYYQNNHNKQVLSMQSAKPATVRQAPISMHPGVRQGGPMNMQSQPAPTLTAQQQQQVSSGTSTASTQKTFDIDGGNFYFAPNKITVNKGDKVTINFKNLGGFHDFVIDGLNVKTPVIMTGKTATVTFTADKAGTYTFYCSVPGHRQKGMQGTLTVQ